MAESGIVAIWGTTRKLADGIGEKQTYMWRPASESTINQESSPDLDAAEARIADAKKAYESRYADLVGMDLKLDAETQSLLKTADASLASRLKAWQDAAARNEAARNGTNLEIEHQKRSMSEQYGCGTGCLFAFLAPFVVGILIAVLSPVIFNDSKSRNAFEVAMENVILLVVILAGLIGTLYSRSRLRAPFRSKIVNLQVVIAKCNQDEPVLAQGTTQAYKELNDFRAWRDGIVPAQPGSGDRKVTLSNVGPNKINTIKVIREVTGLDLKEAMDLLDKVPSTILWAVSLATAEEAVSKFQTVGATASMEQMRSWSRAS